MAAAPAPQVANELGSHSSSTITPIMVVAPVVAAAAMRALTMDMMVVLLIKASYAVHSSAPQYVAKQ